GHVGGGDPGTAEAVEGHAAGGDRVARIEGGHASQVAALAASLVAGAPHDVIHVGGVEIVALGDGPQDRAAEVLRVEVGQRALPDLPDPPRGAAGVDDPGFSHGCPSL